MSPESSGRVEIGATLRDARRRYGMDVREVEERTKIRARYIRALENEDWETLPAPAYVRGFLRTYGQMLGLDGEMLADEYRRRYGDESTPSGASPSEPVLSESRRPGERPASRLPWVIGILGGIVVLLLLLSLLGGGESNDARQGGNGARQAKGDAAKRNGKKRNGSGKKKGKAELTKEDVTVTAVSGTKVCLLGGGEETLIDNQVLGAGAEETYSGSKRYRLTIGPGVLKVKINGNKRRLEVTQPASYEADSRGIREINYRGPECP